MAKKFETGRCVHCLELFQDLTSDHVFPKSWYPDTTPDDLEKWQMPACKACNEKYGRIERDLLLRFGLCLDRNQEGAKGIPERAVSSISPQAGKSTKDSKHRLKRRHKTLREALMGKDIPQSAILPGFGLHPGQELTDAIGVAVGVRELEALATKLVRGITYICTGKYIDKDHAIKVFFDPHQCVPIVQAAEKFGAKHYRGPGIEVQYASAEDDPVSGAFKFTLWGTFRFCAVVNLDKKRGTYFSV